MTFLVDETKMVTFITRRRILIVITATLVVLLAVFGKSALITFHVWRLEAAQTGFYNSRQVVTSDGLVGYDVTDASAHIEYHRDCLVRYGYFFHEQYEFDRVPDADGAHGELWRRIQAAFPDNFHVALTHPDNCLKVWDRPDRRAMYEEFVARHNVPDFVERFMKR